MGEHYLAAAHELGVPWETARPPVMAAREGIGAPLERMRQHLIQCGQTLAGLVEPAGQLLASEATSHLRQQVCRIVVVGQIKSGKSSFINALVHRPSLLPTDVTPWTTTVTNLHFCQPAPGSYASVFQFFSDTEWHALAEGGGRIGELTQRLVPDFEPEVLRQHVESLRRRAGARLGSEYDSLLGRAHYFEDVESEILKRYVCSGDFATHAEASAIGKYSDITKTADLYCEDGPFAFPVTVTDTPGTNDPFLVRDEITRRSLEAADFYIVVLTARQPLSESDVALMRLMRGLDKQRIIVFVNRIDDLSDVGRELPDVMGFIEKKLEAEFPGAEIPVIAGSARWATCALRPEAPALDRLFERRSLAYLGEVADLGSDDLVREAVGDEERRDRLCQALFTASGLPAMYLAIGTQLTASQPARNLWQFARSFKEMARVSANAARYELEAPGIGPGRPHATSAEEGYAELEQQSRLLSEVARNVEQSAKSIEKQLAAIIDEEMEALRRALRSAVETHAAKERDILIETLGRGRAPRVWTHEGVELRRALAGVFAACFKRAATRVLDFEDRVSPELYRLVDMIAPDMIGPLGRDRNRMEISSPSISALSRFVAVDLDVSWWSALWKSRASVISHGEKLEALIKSEFQAVIDELADTAERALNAYAATTTKWSFGLCLNIVQIVKRRQEQLLSQWEALKSSAAGLPHDETAAEDAPVPLAEKLQIYNALARELDTIVHELGRSYELTRGFVS